jgi:hypothetical protein
MLRQATVLEGELAKAYAAYLDMYRPGEERLGFKAHGPG